VQFWCRSRSSQRHPHPLTNLIKHIDQSRKLPIRYVNVVPTSAITGEGISDLLQLMVKLTQSMMGERLTLLSETQCTVGVVVVCRGVALAWFRRLRTADDDAAVHQPNPDQIQPKPNPNPTRIHPTQPNLTPNPTRIHPNPTRKQVLEVKTLEGLGTTIDVVLINGFLREGDRIVACGLQGPIVTRIKALKTPQVGRLLLIACVCDRRVCVGASVCGVECRLHSQLEALAQQSNPIQSYTTQSNPIQSNPIQSNPIRSDPIHLKGPEGDARQGAADGPQGDQGGDGRQGDLA
jgi:hypothetical protein